MKKKDKQIRNLVQMIDLSVPKDFTDKLKRESPESEIEIPAGKRQSPWSWARAAFAATIAIGFAVSLILIIGPATPPSAEGILIKQAGTGKGEQNIIIRSIKVNNKPAKIYCYQSKNRDRLIIWTQKSI